MWVSLRMLVNSKQLPNGGKLLAATKVYDDTNNYFFTSLVVLVIVTLLVLNQRTIIRFSGLYHVMIIKEAIRDDTTQFIF